jgi:hypothetical protein
MASIKQDISLQVENNNFYPLRFSLLGGTQDPSNGQANSTIFYEYDLTAETFIGTFGVSIEASTITNPTVFTYTTNQHGAVTDVKMVLKSLNSLNLGIFNIEGNRIYIIDRINIFGNLTIF